jgi:transcription-repair coupling factor (superfamily II helicase)
MLNLLTSLASPIENYLEHTGDLVAPAATHSLLAAVQSTPLLMVTTSSRSAELITAELKSLVGENAVINFPAWETLPHERLSPKADTVTARFKALNKIRNNLFHGDKSYNDKNDLELIQSVLPSLYDFAKESIKYSKSI